MPLDEKNWSMLCGQKLCTQSRIRLSPIISSLLFFCHRTKTYGRPFYCIKSNNKIWPMIQLVFDAAQRLLLYPWAIFIRNISHLAFYDKLMKCPWNVFLLLYATVLKFRGEGFMKYCLKLWSFFSKVHLLTKSTRFAKSPCSDIDLDFHSLFSTKGPFFVFQIDLWIF